VSPYLFYPKKVTKHLENWAIRWRVPVVVPRIIQTLPHDDQSFTQGLAYQDGVLYESSGGDGTSSVRAVDPQNGATLRRTPVPDYFGEGIAVVRDRLYQLSWKSERAGVFRLPSLERVGEVEFRGEGWGLTSNEEGLIRSDGSSLLRLCDERLQLRRALRVSSNALPIRYLNDLQVIGDRIFANVYGAAELFEISAINGKLLRLWDCRRLMSAAPCQAEAVLNGIAYRPQTNSLFVTGKLWSQLYEISLEV
jgi:glutaminyl-peptide cyclotransferase